MKPNNQDKSFQQRREELLKSRLVTDNGKQTAQYLESLIEDVVLNGVSFDKQLPIFLSFAENEGLDANQLKNEMVVLIDILKSVSAQPSKSEKMGIVFQAQRCHISEEVIQHILSELQEKKKQEETEKRAREKAEAERSGREQEAALPPVIRNIIANMVYVEGGTFMMGATSEQGDDAFDIEEPAHRVTLSSFSIGRYEVTQDEWEAVMGSNPSHFKGAKCPVETVSWDDCQNFIRKLNAMTSMKFRLPTEAEWEFAARGGNKSKGYKFSGSNNIDVVAWYLDDINAVGCNYKGETHPVGQKSPNELGLYDMSGNVCEWCEDWKDDYDGSPQTNPKGPHGSVVDSRRVFRGGNWNSLMYDCRVSNRFFGYPDYRRTYIGLRLAL